MITNDILFCTIYNNVIINSFRHLTDNDILVQEDLKLIIESIIKKQKQKSKAWIKNNSIKMVNI